MTSEKPQTAPEISKEDALAFVHDNSYDDITWAEDIENCYRAITGHRQKCNNWLAWQEIAAIAG